MIEVYYKIIAISRKVWSVMMEKSNSAPTMKDVAKEAGVALGTVSKVVNGLPVGEPYRIRVEEAIRKLNYQVNSYAQGLKANRTHTAALLIPNTYLPFFASLVYHINLALLKRKYRMLLCSTDYDPGLEQEYVAMAQQNKVDGIIGLTYNPDLILDETTPFIAIDRSMGPRIPCVTSDNFAGGQLAAEKLADLGCRNVVFLLGNLVLIMLLEKIRLIQETIQKLKQQIHIVFFRMEII